MPNDVLGVIEKKKPKQRLIVPDPKGVVIDTTNILNYLGTRAKPSQISYAVLRHMALRAKPVAAVIQTRLNQVATFARRPAFRDDTGFKITLKDPDREPTKAERQRAREIEDAILHTGFVPNKLRKDNFNMFLRKLVRDSLVLDALTFELVYNRKGEVCEWWAVDGATVEVVLDQTPNSGNIPVYQPVTKRGIADAGDIDYVQRINSIVVAEWTEEELAYGIRNPRTDIAYNLFGLSELEILVETVTHLLNAESYNGAYFTQNNLPQGVLEIVGKFQDEHLEGFKRAWESLISGAVGKWKVPIMALEEGQGLKFTPFKQNSKDMEFHQWLEFLTSITCAVYQIDPAEIGLKSWSGGRQGLFNSDAESARIDNSKDKGFFPLMQFLAETFNTELIDHIDPNFKFEWVGLREEDTDQKERRRNERLASGFTTVNEERLAEDMPTVEAMLIERGVEPEMAQQLGTWADAPANATLMSVYQMATQQAQQQSTEQTQHAREMEKQMLSQKQQRELAEQQAQQQQDSAQVQHARGLEQQAVSHKQQQETAEQQAYQSQVAHFRSLESNYNNTPNTPISNNNNNNNNSKKRLNQLKKSIQDDDYILIEIELDE